MCRFASKGKIWLVEHIYIQCTRIYFSFLCLFSLDIVKNIKTFLSSTLLSVSYETLRISEKSAFYRAIKEKRIKKDTVIRHWNLEAEPKGRYVMLLRFSHYLPKDFLKIFKFSLRVYSASPPVSRVEYGNSFCLLLNVFPVRLHVVCSLWTSVASFFIWKKYLTTVCGVHVIPFNVYLMLILFLPLTKISWVFYV